MPPLTPDPVYLLDPSRMPAFGSPPRRSIYITLTSSHDSNDVRTLKLVEDEPCMVGRASKSREKSLQSSSTNALFDSPVISRNHAEIQFGTDHNLRDEIVLRDIGSMHGTKVNGKPLVQGDEMPLFNGDRIQFGQKVTRGDDSHDGVIVKYQRGSSFAWSPRHSQADKTAKKSSSGFYVPGDSEEEEEEEDEDDDVEISYSEDEESLNSEDDGEERIASPHTTPDQIKAKLGSPPSPINIEKAKVTRLHNVIDIDSDGEEESVYETNKPMLPPRSYAYAPEPLPEPAVEDFLKIVPETVTENNYALQSPAPPVQSASSAYVLPPLDTELEILSDSEAEELEEESPVRPERSYGPMSTDDDDDSEVQEKAAANQESSQEELSRLSEEAASVMGATALAESRRRVESVYMKHFGKPLPEDPPSTSVPVEPVRSTADLYQPLEPLFQPYEHFKAVPNVSQYVPGDSWATTAGSQLPIPSYPYSISPYPPNAESINASPSNTAYRLAHAYNDYPAANASSASRFGYNYPAYTTPAYHWSPLKNLVAGQPPASHVSWASNTREDRTTSPKTTRINISDIVEDASNAKKTPDASKSTESVNGSTPFKSASEPKRFSVSFGFDDLEDQITTTTSAGEKRKADEMSVEEAGETTLGDLFGLTNKQGGSMSMDDSPVDGSFEKVDLPPRQTPVPAPAQATNTAPLVHPDEPPRTRRRITKHKKASGSTRSGIGGVVKVTAGALAGSVATMAFLCSPLAEKAIEWLA